MLPLWVPSLTSTALFTHMRFVSLCLLMPQLRARFERLETGTIPSQSFRRKCTMSKSQLEISSSSVYLMILSILPRMDLWPWLFQLRFNLTFSFSFWQRHRSQTARCLPALDPSFALSLATGPVRRKKSRRVPTGSQPGPNHWRDHLKSQQSDLCQRERLDIAKLHEIRSLKHWLPPGSLSRLAMLWEAVGKRPSHYFELPSPPKATWHGYGWIMSGPWAARAAPSRCRCRWHDTQIVSSSNGFWIFLVSQNCRNMELSL